jgi:hypothetical protein
MIGLFVSNELERILKEAVASNFKVLSLHFPEGADENHEKPKSEQPVSGRDLKRVFLNMKKGTNRSVKTISCNCHDFSKTFN